MAYSSASAVAQFCYNLLDGNQTFGPNTRPTLKAVNAWLSSGCSVIESKLTGAGYDIPVASTATVYQMVVDLETFFAAARAEMTRTTATVSTQERTRSQVFQQMFDDGLKLLLSTNLDSAGLTVTNRGQIFSGGTTKSDKATRRADSNRVHPRFYREQWLKWSDPDEELVD